MTASRYLLLAVSVVLLPSCLTPLHEPPAAGQPAGTVKFRIQHVHYPGGNLRFHLLVDDRRIEHYPPLNGPSGTWTRVKPGWHRFDIGSAYFTTVSVPQTYTTYESYACGKSTCSRSVTRTRLVIQTNYLGVCKSAYAVYVTNGESYVIGYNYLGHQSCQITCHRQVFTSGERFRLEPCPHAQAVRPSF